MTSSCYEPTRKCFHLMTSSCYEPCSTTVKCWLTQWGRVTHICVGNLNVIGSDNGLSHGRRQSIIWINVGVLLIGPLGINFSENKFEMQPFSVKQMHRRMSSSKWRPFCLGLNVLRPPPRWTTRGSAAVNFFLLSILLSYNHRSVPR